MMPIVSVDSQVFLDYLRSQNIVYGFIMYTKSLLVRLLRLDTKARVHQVMATFALGE